MPSTRTTPSIAPARLFEVFAYIHLDRLICLAVIERLGVPQELPQDVFMRFGVCVSVEGLGIRAARENTDRARTVDFCGWSI